MSVFSPAVRKKSKLRLALTGVSGAGKTLGALYIAYGITGDWSKIALIDTEHERARFYADRQDLGTGAFLWASLLPPYSPERYKAFVADAAASVGSDGVVIIDSFSHAWKGSGGILELKDKIADQRGKNSYTAWNEAGAAQNNLVDTILSVDCHTIVTMRSKMDYVMQEDEHGRVSPKKVGLAPVQRDDTEYEFDIVIDIARNHFATTTKDTTFLDEYCAIITPELGQQLAAWLNDGAEPPRCEVCKQVIAPAKRKSAQQFADGTRSYTGKALCVKCWEKWQVEHRKEQLVGNETETHDKS